MSRYPDDPSDGEATAEDPADAALEGDKPRVSTLDEVVDPWDLFKRLGDMKQQAGDRSRRALFLFVLLYVFLQFLNGAQVSTVSLFGVDISDAGSVVLLIPVLMALVFLDQIQNQIREIRIVEAMGSVTRRFLAPTISRNTLEAATPGTLMSSAGSLLAASDPIGSHTNDSPDLDLGNVALVMNVLIVIVQLFALASAVIGATTYLDGWHVGEILVAVAVPAIVASTIGLFFYSRRLPPEPI